MSPAHRPLSAWIAHLDAGTYELGLINNGDHRRDARTMDEFREGWRRVAVPSSAGSPVLGLTLGDGSTVVELDDAGSPIPISRPALDIIDNIEQRWPVIDDALAASLPSLAGEPLPVRYWLLERLDAEGDPPDHVFAILPWEMLDGAVEAVTAGLERGGAVGRLVEIRHWLTPAVRGLTGPLEQLDHGLRTGDKLIARRGATSLLTNLLETRVSRIPERSRVGLARLVALLAGADSWYSRTSRVVAARLAGHAAIRRLRAELHSDLEAAAGTDNARDYVEVLDDDLVQIQLVESRGGRLQVTAQIPAVDPANAFFAPRIGAFLPIWLRPRTAEPPRRFWIALFTEDSHLTGTLSLILSRGWSMLDADAPPVGAQELASVAAEELLASMRSSTAPTAQQWLDTAEQLPEDHPVRRAAETFRESL